MSLASRSTCGSWTWMCLLMIVYVNVPCASGIQACGESLNDVLRLFCKNGFATIAKKSIGSWDSEGLTGADTSELSVWAEMEGNSMIKTRRRRFGVVNECCFKACLATELMPYCKE